MESLHLGQYQPYIILAIGIILIIVSLFYKSKVKTLEKTGERCEGIIFKLGYSNSFGADMTSSNVKDKITVRFVTKNKEWITQDLHSDFMISYTAQYKEGDRVNVIYNPENPSEFMVETKQSQTLGRLVGLFIGLAFVGTGIYELFKPR
jgi:hypothetical protein